MTYINQKKYSVEEIRKTHPRMGMKWDRDEDERLKKAYTDWRDGGASDFDLFVSKLVKDFERAVGGLKARLAMHFEDVPGWDYLREQYRSDELNKQVEDKFNPEKDELLRGEYKNYNENKNETYIAFLRRLAEKLGIEGKFITHRLGQLVGDIEKFRRDDVRPKWETKKREEEPVPEVDFSSNPESQKALHIMNDTRDNLFLTGEAGTGKSTLLQYFRRTTEKNVVVLAPTGVAALNVEGQTIHSFCSFGPDITLAKVKKLGPWDPKRKLLAKLDTMIIDEISMVRADLLDCVDKFLRVNGFDSHTPFGGIQMIFIGDLFQLPPVEKDFGAGHGLLKEYQSPYFFDSKVFRQTPFMHIQLRQIYRQQEQVFIDVLNAVRNNAVSQDHLTVLNQRAQTEDDSFSFEKFAIYLTPTNQRARQVNNFFLERIQSELKTYEGKALGSFEDRELPTDLNLQVKVGSQVMMLNNDRRKRWVNGTMGKVVGICKNDDNLSDEALAKSNDDNDERSASGVIPEATSVAESYPESISYVSDRSYEFYQSYGEIGSVIPGSDPESRVSDFSEDESSSADTILIELETGETVYVQPHTWEMYKFVLDKDTQSIDSRATGSYTQYPFKLAWAVTIHKSQGKTFNKVYIDLSTGTFAHGQLYVALSRCRTLSGLYLKRPISQQDIILDDRVVDFLNSINTESR